MPTKITYADGSYRKYTYDGGKRVTSVSGNTGTVNYSYDTRNNITAVNNYGFTYNAFDGMLNVKYKTKILAENTYNNYGLLTQQKYANNYTVNYEYDALERITKKYIMETER